MIRAAEFRAIGEAKLRCRGGIAAALCLAACLAFAGCARRAAQPEEYPESYAEGAILRLSGGSLSPLVTAAPGNAAEEGVPAGVAPVVAAAAAAADGRSAFLALNRTGLAVLRIDPERRRYRIDPVDAGNQFPGRSVGGLFLRGGTLYCLLYRDPLFETQPPRDPPSLLLAADLENPVPEARPFDLGLGGAGGNLFALFPRSDGSWALQLRREVPEGFEISFHSYDPTSGAVRVLARGEFERMLAPRPLTSAPDSLRRAARVLAPEGFPVTVSASLADGTRASFTFGDGPPEDTVELRGAVTESGTVLVAWNAVAAVAREGSEASFRLPVPMPGAVYRDAVPLAGAVLAIWEVGVFPNVEESGVVLLPAP